MIAACVPVSVRVAAHARLHAATIGLAVTGLLLVGSAALAQSPTPVAPGGPPPPQAPEVIARDASGQATVRATRLSEPLRIDGRLDEAIYATVPSMSGFIQNEPLEGAPASQKTEVWLFFDRDNVYVVARCWESRMDRMVANEMRRDGNIGQQDQFAFSFDTFRDKRNGFLFEVNPLGGRLDGQITNERQMNRDWNPVWSLKTGRFEGGWTMEAALPFKSLRFAPGVTQVWGFQARRKNFWKNETSYLTPIPAAIGTQGHFRMSLSPAVVGIEAPTSSRNLEVKPYVITDLNTDKAATPKVLNNPGADAGVDMKYGIGRSLTADVTVRTDFAQVEADDQQVNLTRFNLFFPEKREFFLENSGTFTFGGAAPSGSGPNATSGDKTPVLFYSRQIGIAHGREVPILGGGRVTGRVGRFSVGALNIEAGEDAAAAARATNFTAVRLKRDILRKSSVGVILTDRSRSVLDNGHNSVYGVDGSFAFFNNLVVNTYWAQSHTPGLDRDNASVRAQMDYSGDRYGLQVERLTVGDHFNPEVGFVPRPDMRRTYAVGRFSPRPRKSAHLRKLSWTGSVDYIEDGTGRLETREVNGEFAIDFHNGDRVFVSNLSTHESLPAPFRIARNVTLPVADYDFNATKLGYNIGRQRLVSANLLLEHGSFYNGHKTVLSASAGRASFGTHLSVEPSVSMNRVRLAQGDFTTNLIGSRITYTVTPLMFASALIQYNSATASVASNVRFRWEYQPGSELFVVYNEQRDTLAPAFPSLVNRSVIVKVNRLLRF